MNKESISVFSSSEKKSTRYLPASKQQQQVWMLQQLHPDNPVYNISVAFRIKGELNSEILDQSYSKVINSNEVLRTCFLMYQGGLKQMVTPAQDVAIIKEEIKLDDNGDSETAINHYVGERISMLFDLSQSPPFITYLLKIAGDDHLLLFVSHQAVADQTSLDCVFQRISEHYASIAAGIALESSKSKQYSEFVDYQNQQKKQNSFPEKLDYWKNSVLSPNGFLDIPVAQTRPSTQSFEGAIYDCNLAEHVLKGVQELGNEMDIPISTIFLSAFQILLFRYTGNESFSIGIPFSNRSINRFHDLIGPLENILPFTTDLSDSPTLQETLQRTQKTLQEASKHQEVTFDSVVEAINPIRDPSYNPLFQVGFRFFEASDLIFNNLNIKRYECFNQTSIVDLFLYIIEDEGCFKIQFVYNPKLFDSTVISAFTSHYQTLLEGVKTSKEIPISLLEILPESEKHKQLIEWNSTQQPPPTSQKIHEFFEYQASRNPDNIAVVFENHSLTYKELDQRANQLAHYLQKYKIEPDVLVGVCLERSCEMMIALLGVLKAGGGYIPMDPDYPKDRLAYIAENSNAPVLITQESLLSFLPESNASVVCIDKDWKDIETFSADKFPDKSGPENIAYVIYTSGSTGKPKGVQVPHGAVANLMASMAKKPGMNKDDVLVCVTTYSFDLSVPDLYLPFYVGARTVFVRTEIAADGIQLAKILKETNATFMQATPSTWMLLLDSGWEGSKNLTVLCGGEAWPRKLARELVPRVKALWNMYGPTETTVWSTCFHVASPDSEVLVGKPMDNTSVYILDENLHLVPIGVPGELHIGGHGVSLGYLGRPDLNKKSFIKNPFDMEGHTRIYKTGDSVRYRPDGNIEYLNRLDNQVKIRGLRIELGEIETVLVKFPNIKQGIVIVREDNPDDKRLVSYFVAGEGSSISEKELRSYLKGILPSYMVPQHLIHMEELPKTPNGKLDRKALPIPQQITSNKKAHYRDPTHLIKLPMGEWFTKPVWKAIPLESNAELPQAAICLIFLDEEGIGELLADRLREKEYDVITVRSADSYHKFNEREYCINPEQGISGYSSLVRDLVARGRFPNRVAHLWMLTGKEEFRPGSSFFHRNLEHGFYSILHLVQALHEQGVIGNMQVVAALNGSQAVHSEQITYPEKTCSLGPCLAMTRELTQVKASVVDIDLPSTKSRPVLKPVKFIRNLALNRYAKLMERELLVPAENEIIAYRKGQRYVKKYETITLPSTSEKVLKENGVYLITGGLGRIGKQVATYLCHSIKARLIIVDLKKLPEKKDWSNYLSNTHNDKKIADGIKTLREIESHGDVLYYSTDIADAEKMRELVEDAIKQFGHINGVIHAADMDSTDPIAFQNNDKIERCFAAKVGGTLVLDQLFRGTNLDLFILFSSSDVATANIGKVNSVAANSFINAYTESCTSNKNRKTICLDWGVWKQSKSQTEIENDSSAEPDASMLTDNERFDRYMLSQGITPEEGLQVFKQSLVNQSGVLTISPVNLSEYISEVELRSGKDEDELVEPRDDIERTLVKFWKEIIGIRNLGVRQDFFDIGGHSLTAVRLFAKIKQAYDIQWPLSVLFEAPTIESCAKLIREETQDNDAEAKDGKTGLENRFLVKMHDGPGNDTTPVFIAAGGFGNILNLRHLAQLLGDQRPVYGIQAKGLMGDEKPHETFEEAAVDYLNEIRKIQPNGPYLFSGFCSGGTIAYEMAQQLIHAGETVSHLVMLDTIATDWREKLTKKDKIDFHRMNFNQLGPKYIFLWVKNRFQWEWKKLQEKLGLNKENTGPAVFRGRVIFDATLRAEENYKPKPYEGKVTLFRPKLDQFVHLDGGRAINKKRDFVRSDNGWSPHIKHLDIQEIAAEPGDHDGFVLEPAVRDLARRFRQLMD